MTRMPTTTLAVNADYADALLTARRAKNTLFIVLLLILVAQIALFFLIRYDVFRLDALRPAGSEPAISTTQPEGGVKISNDTVLTMLHCAVDLTVFLGTTLSFALWLTVLVMLLIMLVGRLIGVTHVTRALFWATILLVFLFPWQIFFSHTPAGDGPTRDATTTTDSLLDTRTAAATHADFYYVPGVLYDWSELSRDVHFPNRSTGRPLLPVLKWARFVGFPVVALLILLMVQTKSARGARFGLGETEVQVDVTTGAL